MPTQNSGDAVGIGPTRILNFQCKLKMLHQMQFHRKKMILY